MRSIILVVLPTLLGLAVPASAQVFPPSHRRQFRDPVALVESWYQRYLGRGIQNDFGVAGWVQQLQQGVSPEAVQAGILSSDEYFARNGWTAQGFVQGLFRDVLGRAPTSDEFNRWVRRARRVNRQDLAFELLTQNPGSAPPGRPSWDWRR